MLFLLVFISGFGVTGGQAGVNALTGTYYPTELRSTGLGAGLGVGRIGSIVGPELAGDLLGRHWSHPAVVRRRRAAGADRIPESCSPHALGTPRRARNRGSVPDLQPVGGSRYLTSLPVDFVDANVVLVDFACCFPCTHTP